MPPLCAPSRGKADSKRVCSRLALTELLHANNRGRQTGRNNQNPTTHTSPGCTQYRALAPHETETSAFHRRSHEEQPIPVSSTPPSTPARDQMQPRTSRFFRCGRARECDRHRRASLPPSNVATSRSGDRVRLRLGREQRPCVAFRNRCPGTNPIARRQPSSRSKLREWTVYYPPPWRIWFLETSESVLPAG